MILTCPAITYMQNFDKYYRLKEQACVFYAVGIIASIAIGALTFYALTHHLLYNTSFDLTNEISVSCVVGLALSVTSIGAIHSIIKKKLAKAHLLSDESHFLDVLTDKMSMEAILFNPHIMEKWADFLSRLDHHNLCMIIDQVDKKIFAVNNPKYSLPERNRTFKMLLIQRNAESESPNLIISLVQRQIFSKISQNQGHLSQEFKQSLKIFQQSDLVCV